VEEDRWVWSPDDDGAFTFKSAYSLIAGEMLNETYLGTETGVFHSLSKGLAPAKAIAYS
jgi:hypothetical protein